MQVAERLGDKAALAFACNSRAVISVIQGNNREAVHYFEKTRALYRGEREHLRAGDGGKWPRQRLF